VKSEIITLYVLRGLRSRKRYVGITNDLPRRLAEHRLKTSKGSQLIEEFEVILTEEYSTYLTAREREKFLKSGQDRQWLDLTLGK
jgi:putative endonuclease